MSWIDLGLMAVLGVFVGIGAMRGFVSGILGVIALLGAYAAAWFATTQLATPLGEGLGISPFAALAISGVVAFLGVYLVLSIGFRMFLRARRKRSSGISPADRVGGALLGGAQGGLIVVLLSWLVGQAQAGGLLGGSSEPGPLVQASQHVVQSGAEAVLGGEGGNPAAARLIADPVGTANQLQAVLEAPSMSDLRDDQLFWQYVSSGAIDAAVNQASFMRATHDAELRRRVVELGVMPEAALDDPKAFRDATRDALEQVAPRIQAIQNDPEFQSSISSLAADPAVQRALNEGNVLALATNPKIRELVSRVLDAGPPAAPAD
jgi:uncharacterized membrane protein required for colicin V production